MKRSFTLVIIVIVAALLAAPAWNFQDKKPIAAYIMKVVNNVERRGGPSQGWTKAVLLAELKAGGKELLESITRSRRSRKKVSL